MAGGVRWRTEYDDQRVIVGYRLDIYDSDIVTKAITAITKANPGVVTATAHGFSDGDKVFIFNVGGMTEINFTIQTVANKTANTFEVEDTTSFTAYTTGGTANATTEIDSGGDPLNWEYGGQDSDKYGLDSVEGVIKSSIVMFVLKLTAEGQFDDIIDAQDDQFKIYFYKDLTNTHDSGLFTATDNLEFSGSLVPENISQPYNMIPNYPVSFIAKDGLERLKDIDFEDSGAPINGRQSVLTTLMFCLNLLDNKDNPEGSKIGIFESINLYEAGMDDSLDLSPVEQADIDPAIFRTDDDRPLNCEEVVYALCIGFQFRLYMARGRWNIERVNQLNGTIERRLFDTDLNLLSTESAYDPIILSGASLKILTSWMSRKSWKAVTGKFNAGQAINFVPFGEFEAGAFATVASFVSGGWTISGSATIEKVEVNQPGSEFGVMITSLSSGVGDFISSPAIKTPTGNFYTVKYKTRVDVQENTVLQTAPNFWWLISWQQAAGTVKYLYDNLFARNITNITQANPGVVTCSVAHGMTTVDQILIGGVFGMTELNGVVQSITVTSPTEFTIEDTTSFTAYISGGTVSRYFWNAVLRTNPVDITQINAITDQNIGSFFIPDLGDAGDMFIRLYELDPGSYTPIAGTGILYDRMIGTINPSSALPVEIQEVTAEISLSGSTFRHPGFEIGFGDVQGFANQDFVLPTSSELKIRIVFGSTVAGDTLQFDINGTARTFTTAIGRVPSLISKANPAVVTDPSHPYNNGDILFFWDVLGMTELNGPGQIGDSFTVANKAVNTYELQGVDSTGFGTYTSGKTLVLSSDTFEDGPSLRAAIKNYATTGYKVGSQLETGGLTDLVTVLGTPPDSAKDMGTVTIDLSNGSDFSVVSQVDATEAEVTVTSRPLSKGAITVGGNVTQGWYEKGDSFTDTDEGGTNISHIRMLLLGILRNQGNTTKKHDGVIKDMTGAINFGTVVHDSVNDNGVFYSMNGMTFNAGRLDWNGEIVQQSNSLQTVAFTTIEKTVGESINDARDQSPYIIGPTVTEIINFNILTSGINLITGQLTAAEVKALNTTQIVAIQPGGTDVVNVPVRVMWRMALNSGNFDSGHTIQLRNAAVTSFLMSNFPVTGFTAGQIKYEMETIDQNAKGSIEQKNSAWEFFAAADSAGGDSTVEFAIQYFEWIPK